MTVKTIVITTLLSLVVFSTAAIIKNGKKAVYTERRFGPPITKIGKQVGVPQVQWGNMSAKLDHFNDDDDTTWNQRYTYTYDLFQEGGPILIYVGGEWTIDTGSLMNGQIVDIAREVGAALFYLEHRFYGESMPTSDFSSENLQYLTSAQAMGDLVDFIEFIRQDDRFTNSKVGLTGCSYSAALVTWFKHVQPDAVDAVWASSGPVLAKDNFYEYNEVVGRVIRETNEECWNVIHNGVQQMEESFDQDNGVEVKLLLRACDESATDNILDREQIFDSIGVHFANTIQYAQPGDVDELCQQLLGNPGNSDNETLANYVTSGLAENECNPIGYNYAVNSYTDETSSNRAWFYQTCNEFGYFMTSSGNESNPFGHFFDEPDYNHQMCQDAFGDDFTAENIINSIDETNENYGGKIPSVANVISVHGGNDPWHTLGMDASDSETAPVIIISGASHCNDQAAISVLDPPELMATKQTLLSTMVQWLQ